MCGSLNAFFNVQSHGRVLRKSSQTHYPRTYTEVITSLVQRQQTSRCVRGQRIMFKPCWSDLAATRHWHADGWQSIFTLCSVTSPCSGNRQPNAIESLPRDGSRLHHSAAWNRPTTAPRVTLCALEKLPAIKCRFARTRYVYHNHGFGRGLWHIALNSHKQSSVNCQVCIGLLSQHHLRPPLLS